MKNYFLDIVKIITESINHPEQFTLWFSGEELDFARFNQGKIRQAGSIKQSYIDLDLIVGQKHATANLGLSGSLNIDKITITEHIKKLREEITQSHNDPFLMIHEGKHNTESEAPCELLDQQAIVETILKTGKGLDLVGCYFGGPIYKGFANSFGQVNWFLKSSFVLDYSIYHSGDKAIKQCYADTRFNGEVLSQKIASAKAGLRLFDKTVSAIKPGLYRVYFSPTAVYEIMSMINWGGFSRKAFEVKTSPLYLMHEKNLAKEFSLSENIAGGVGPNFQSQGFMKKDFIPIIDKGRLKNTLISPKTAKEYCLDHNGADENESMCSMDMQGGELLEKDIHATLKDGLMVNNLWYLNFSDRQNGCMTGMTRFFCYTVKNGEPHSCFSVMRFDESIFRLLGENLSHITKTRELIIDNSTYDERSTSCAVLPGIIAENVRFTL